MGQLLSQGGAYNILTLIFQLFLKVAEESGVDAETSGNPLGGCTLLVLPPPGCLSSPGLCFFFHIVL